MRLLIYLNAFYLNLIPVYINAFINLNRYYTQRIYTTRKTMDYLNLQHRQRCYYVVVVVARVDYSIA